MEAIGEWTGFSAFWMVVLVLLALLARGIGIWPGAPPGPKGPKDGEDSPNGIDSLKEPAVAMWPHENEFDETDADGDEERRERREKMRPA